MRTYPELTELQKNLRAGLREKPAAEREHHEWIALARLDAQDSLGILGAKGALETCVVLLNDAINRAPAMSYLKTYVSTIMEDL